VLSIVEGETTAVEAARKHDLTVPRSRAGRHFLLAAENALRSRPEGRGALHQEQVKKLERKSASW